MDLEGVCLDSERALLHSLPKSGDHGPSAPPPGSFVPAEFITWNLKVNKYIAEMWRHKIYIFRTFYFWRVIMKIVFDIVIRPNKKN